VIDLKQHKWSDVRKSYRGLINQGHKKYDIWELGDIFTFMKLHRETFGNCRTDETYLIQDGWIKKGNCLIVAACDKQQKFVAAAMWIVYNGGAYYASGPSIERNAMHGVIWESLQLLNMVARYVDMGQVDGETEKERSIAQFKCGFGGDDQPFTIVRKLNGGS
jgi:hypothetical protein